MTRPLHELEPPTTVPRARPKPTRRPQRLADCEVGRVYTLRVVVMGERQGGDKFCRALTSDGREGEPCTLPADWAIGEELP